ncbi:MAG: carbonic anhydrase family protein [Prochloraceae cyanobacterium]|nr:carbonic anhydrase family protein [Prochloraceae cyanobacterium]
MKRRALLKYLSLSTAGAAFSFAFPSLTDAVTANQNTSDWGYDRENGPNLWGEISPDFQTCQIGTQQSPIDLDAALHTDTIGSLLFDYHTTSLHITNNSHSIQLNVDRGNNIILDGKKFDLLQFHFHHQSEHTVKGQKYPMELHLVHKNPSGELAVIGVFLKEGKDNLALQPVWKHLPKTKEPLHTISGTVNLKELLPADKKAFRYYGSLTTPPCSEIVNWIVFETPVEISPQQLTAFANIFPQNARPVQPRNHRLLLES